MAMMLQPNLVDYHQNKDDIKISAYLIKPVVTRSKKNDIVILVNGRTIKKLLVDQQCH